ncbi:hypothetical protein KIN20_007544 [Parelaphostrongylus tenuis]|uniref:guanylate cyclase n=1 Tax=Parelaphostrongylus tenuis TaxID=148309 RepID=A0AAD5QK35_PARTN|nr:hypothetical protein KIN20_007544 [Parelaphostrongylus tenuis]
MRQLNHDNISTFLGICVNELDNFYILYALIDRASLEDFIKDPDFPIDDLFRSAFLRDILKGLQYLHKSPIRCHGLLLTKNCLVDSNWVLKLTHFGVVGMLHEFIEGGVLRSLPEYHLNPDSLVAEIIKRRLKPEVNEYDSSPEQKAFIDNNSTILITRSVAQVLKEGGTIPPRSYDAATVCFVQLCAIFQHLLERVDQMRWRQPAKHTWWHLEYQMRTKDVTFVEIAECSLDIREESYTYVVAHCPELQSTRSESDSIAVPSLPVVIA